MTTISDIIDHLQHRFFKSIVSNNLVYNTCWEDPRVDRQLLQLNSKSKVLMLTSAGCNALDYLLDDPAEIHCVDTNPAQNALLEFKYALLKNGNYQLLWDFFGDGKKRGAELIYHNKLRRYLSSSAQDYWDQNISSFTPATARPSFYYSGTSGKVAWLMYRRIQRKGLYPLVEKLLNADTLDEQDYYFDKIEPQLWSTFSKWIVRQHATMAMLGVPTAQRKMVESEYRGGLFYYIRRSLKKVFTERPISDNYFWRVYLTGKYTTKCCPNYLRKQHFQKLSQTIDRLNTGTTSLHQFLKRNPGTYSHFVLLDHQDWMAGNQPKLLKEEWRQILANSKPGTRILFRSAGSIMDFLPGFVYDEVEFQPEITQKLHQKDRVGTYESTHLGVVQ